MIFYKYHSLGNDFIIVERSLAYNAEDLSAHGALAPWIKDMCNRHTGIGADGLIFVSFINDVWHASIFNSDGSYGQFSGNGVRCVAWFLVEHKEASSPLMIRMGGMSLRLCLNEQEKHEAFITTEVAIPSYYGSVTIVVDDEELVGHIVIGANPHLIIERKTEDISWLHKHGASLEHYKGDGSRINVECIWPAEDGAFHMRVFERGAGITQACSSGVIACQSFLMHMQRVSVQQKIAWHNLGGTVVAVSYKDHLEITASATFVYQGTLSNFLVY